MFGEFPLPGAVPVCYYCVVEVDNAVSEGEVGD